MHKSKPLPLSHSHILPLTSFPIASMATKSEGIQRLLQAEQRANVKVAEAKKSKLF